jgi:NADH-quinone oxidoreductase subunit G
VLRVLGNLLDLPGFDFESSQDVLKQIQGAQAAQEPADRLDNSSEASVDLSTAPTTPAAASIYQLDGLVRRATSLQLTADARLTATASASAGAAA